jgi:D-lactate dehydrogenase
MKEEKLFFNDLSENVIQDDMIMRLLSFPNVLITSHQGFFTEEALTQIAQQHWEILMPLRQVTLKNSVVW